MREHVCQKSLVHSCCRLLVGMHRPPVEELRAAMGLAHRDEEIDNQTALRLKKKLAEDFREQLAIGTPTNEDEACLRRLAHRVGADRVVLGRVVEGSRAGSCRLLLLDFNAWEPTLRGCFRELTEERASRLRTSPRTMVPPVGQAPERVNPA